MNGMRLKEVRPLRYLKRNMHLLLLLFWPFQIVWYALLQEYAREMPRYFSVHCALDSEIPFVPVFIIPYLLWYAYIAVTMGYFAFRDKQGFYRLCLFMFTGITLCLTFCTVFPNGHDFRPTEFASNNIFVSLVKWVYRCDPSCVTIFPSMHVLNGIATHIAIAKSERLSRHRWLVWGSFLFFVSVCLSTVFVKQHSVLDVAAALLLAIPLYFLGYKTKFPFFSQNK